jgi:hypothetical protein
MMKGHLDLTIHTAHKHDDNNDEVVDLYAQVNYSPDDELQSLC